MSDNPNYPIATAAVNWFDSSSQLHLRVYATNDDATTEWCFDPATNWTQGSYTAS